MATMAASPEEEGTSRFVQAGNLKLHYNEAGSGDVALMLHGGGPGASGWSNFSKNVGPISERFRVILLDLPGYGKSDSVVVQGGRAAFNAETIKSFIDVLKIPRLHLIGNSLGGATSARLAAEYPDRVGKVVLMGAAGGGTSLFVPMPSEGIKLLNAVFAHPVKESFKKLMELFVYDKSWITDELLERRWSAVIDNPDHLEARRQSTPGVEDLTRDFPRIQAESLIVWGRDDRMVPIDHALALLWRIPKSRLHIYSECGHWVQYEKADEFNRLVLDFLTH
jgi:pimeloyl-ACP methyl ester carboxylesterase